MINVLRLASKSPSRRLLLETAKIPHILIEQDADEKNCDWSKPIEEVVLSIAKHKMNHVVLENGLFENELLFVLTADTLCLDPTGAILGKPIDRDDAIRMIKQSRGKNIVSSAFCLSKKRWNGKFWETIIQKEQVVSTELFFDVPDAYIAWYLDNTIAEQCAGAMQVENAQAFLQKVHGSYSCIVGLPLFEVRCALQELGFFDSNL